MEQISALGAERRPGRTVEITSVRSQESQHEEQRRNKGTPWQFDFTKEVSLNGVPNTENHKKGLVYGKK